MPSTAGASVIRRFEELLVIPLGRGEDKGWGQERNVTQVQGDSSGDKQRKSIGLISSTERRGLSVVENEPICL